MPRDISKVGEKLDKNADLLLEIIDRERGKFLDKDPKRIIIGGF